MQHLIKSLQSKGKAVTPASIETESLFHSGGTVTEEQAREYLRESAKVADVVEGVAELLEGSNLHSMAEYCRNIQRDVIRRKAGKDEILRILSLQTNQGYYQEALYTVTNRIKAL